MWFSDPDRYGIYWVTNEEQRNELKAPKIVPREAPYRRYEKGVDWVWDQFAGKSETGELVFFQWVISPGFIETGAADVPKVEFPKTPTLQNLAELFGVAPKNQSATVRLDPKTYLTKNRETYTLHVDGTKVIGWSLQGTEAMMWWNILGALTQNTVDALRKYLGTNWKLVDKNGLVGLENKAGEWVLASQYTHMTIDGRLLDKEGYKKICDPIIQNHDLLVKQIAKYVEGITPEKIIRATRGMTGTTHSIITRCEGCQSCNAMHLAIHMARGDLDSFLIYSAYDAFGPEIFGGGIRHTWDLVADPTSARVEQLKEIMRKFLMDAVQPRLSYACFMPTERRQGSIKWELFGTANLVVDNGVRLVQGRRNPINEDGLRDGEWMAREVRENRQLRNYPLARLRRRVHNPFNLDDDIEIVQPRWEEEAEDLNEIIMLEENEINQ